MSPPIRYEGRHRPPSPTRFFAAFGYAWLTIGLFLGTLVLVVAVRGILDVLDRMGLGQTAQNRLLMLVILLFVLVSFLMARAVVRWLYRQTPRKRRMGLIALAVPAVLCGYAWSNPTRFLSRFAGGQASSFAMRGGPKFIFGSYPDDTRLAELKKEGVTSIVSLQSPEVPVEIQGINAERDAARREHLQFIEAPMLPWVSDNTEALEKIKQIALTGKGVYYVHCGLGRDRVNIAKRLIESLQPVTGARAVAASDLKHAAGFESRTEAFERGLPMRLASDSWVVPFLNDDEFYGFIIQGQPGHVYLALDPRDTLQGRWIAEARTQMTRYAVPFSVLPYPAANGDTSTKAIVAQLHALNTPYTVIVPKMPFVPGPPNTPVATALARAYGVQVQAPPKSVPLLPGETPDLAPVTPATPGGKAAPAAPARAPRAPISRGAAH